VIRVRLVANPGVSSPRLVITFDNIAPSATPTPGRYLPAIWMPEKSKDGVRIAE
jgi:hypothetical protein